MAWNQYIMSRITKGQHARQSSFGFIIQLLARRIDSVMKKRLGEIGVDTKIFANLMLLNERDGVTQTELGRLLEFPDYYTSRNVDALIEAGFAERQPDPNSRRNVLIFLTPKGREKAKELPKIINLVNTEFLQVFDKEEKKVIIKLLQKAALIPENGDPNL